MNRIKKVVVIYGDGDSGKTDTLCRLCDLLINQATGAFILRKAGGRKQLGSLPKNKRGKYQDVLFAGAVKGKNGNDVTVGVGTAGDTWDAVWRNFMFFDSVWPERQFDIVFVAIREQSRKDGLGKHDHSFPLLALEELECHYSLNGVQRPFERTMVAENQFQVVNQQLANKLMGMV